MQSSSNPSQMEQSILPQQNTSTPLPKDNSGNISQPALYRLNDSTDTLILDRFIRCLCDSDFRALVIEGEPPVAEIEKAWFGIYSKYIDLCQTTDLKYSLRLQNDVIVLSAKLERIKLAITYLQVQFDEEMIQALRDYGFNRPYNWDDQAAFIADLKWVAQRSMKLRLKADLKEAELKAYQDSQKGEAPDRIYFTKILMRLSDHAGYGLKSTEITVTEFAVRKQEYLDHLERHQKK